MDLEKIIYTAAAGSIFGIFTFIIHKYISWKVDKELSARKVLSEKGHVEKYDAIKRISGLIAQIEHYMNRVADGNEEYIEKCKICSAEVRSLTRENRFILGEEYVRLVKSGTDMVVKFCDNKGRDQLESWILVSSEIHLAGQELLRKVDM